MRLTHPLILAAILASAVGAPTVPAAFASDAAPQSETASLPEGSDVLPLSEVLDRIMPAIDGEIAETRLRKDGGLWIYVIAFFDEDGKRQELRVNAMTGEILAAKTTR